MRAGRFLATVIAFVGLISAVKASRYVIDTNGCTAAQRDFVRASMGNATDMATSGLNAIDSPNEAQTQLIKWLFGDLGVGQRSIREMFSASNGVLRFTESTDQTGLQPEDLKIYCDQSRIVKRQRAAAQWYDTDIEAAVLDKQIDRCDSVMGTMGYTVRLEGHHWQIQICPWFIDKAMNQPIRYRGDILKRTWNKMADKLEGLLTKLLISSKLTAMDMASLFDSIMLHELTHSHSDPGKVTSDHAYGWKSCRALSTVTTDTSVSPQVEGPEYNADTYALYGVGIFLISEGLTINEDGTLTGSSAALTKRNSKIWVA